MNHLLPSTHKETFLAPDMRLFSLALELRFLLCFVYIFTYFSLGRLLGRVGKGDGHVEGRGQPERAVSLFPLYVSWKWNAVIRLDGRCSYSVRSQSILVQNLKLL